MKIDYTKDVLKPGPKHCPGHPQTDSGIEYKQNYADECYWDATRGEWLERGAGIEPCPLADNTHPWPNRANIEEEWA